jgi:hypothetical protein
MKKWTTDINTKWAMNYKAYKRAKENKQHKRVEKIRRHLFEMLQYYAIINHNKKVD